MGLHRRPRSGSREKIDGFGALRDVPTLAPAAPVGASKQRRERPDAGEVPPKPWQSPPFREPLAPRPKVALPATQEDREPAYPPASKS